MVIIRIGLEFYVGFCLTISYVLLDLLIFGRYLDIDPLNFMLVQGGILEIMEFVLVLELFKFANIWIMVFGWWIFSFEIEF